MPPSRVRGAPPRPAVTRKRHPHEVRGGLGLRPPVVAADPPALAELVQDGVTGRLVAPDDVDALAAVLAELVDDPGTEDATG